MNIKSTTKTGRARWFWLAAGLVLVAAAAYLGWSRFVAPRVTVPEAKNFPVSGNVQEAETADNLEEPEDVAAIPAKKLIPVPFTPQAPTANWDELHNEACEEASALMAAAYFAGRTETNLTPEYAEAEIAKLTEWQKKNYGYNLSITTAEAAKMIEEVYGLNAKIVEFPSEAALKKELAEGRLVIYPAAGRLLGNPYYTPPGPLYHMLVIKGYDSLGFITNDPGTKRGLNYAYDYETLKTAGGEWIHARHDMDTSNKQVIIVSK